MIYFIQAKGTNLVKIGYTDNVKLRLSNLQVSCPHRLIIMKTIDGSFAFESSFHRVFSKDHIRGEWFSWSLKLQQFIDNIPEGTKDFSELEVKVKEEQRLQALKINMEHEIERNKIQRRLGKTGLPL